jgi:hypothetical protein
MKKIVCFVLVCLAATTLFAGVLGATTIYSPEYSGTVGGGPAGWTDSLTVPKFDPALGSLMGIKFTLSGDASGTTKFENESNYPATVLMNLTATLRLTRPAPLNTVIVESIPLAPTTDTVPGYDLVTDYSGPGGSQTTGSGRTHAGLTANDTEYFTSFAPADLALFQAAFAGENIVLPVTSLAGSFGSSVDTGDLALHFSTNAGATAKVQYVYDAVPEPSSMMALLSGVCGLLGMGMKRRRA